VTLCQSSPEGWKVDQSSHCNTGNAREMCTPEIRALTHLLFIESLASSRYTPSVLSIRTHAFWSGAPVHCCLQ